MTRWTVHVEGVPATKGSMKCVGRGGRHQLIEDDKPGTRREWRQRVADGARAVLAQAGGPLDGPVALVLTWTLPRPPSAPKRRVWPVVRSAGDVDKLQRLVLDAITDSGLWHDDSQACRVLATKAYLGAEGAAATTGVTMTIWRIDET